MRSKTSDFQLTFWFTAKVPRPTRKGAAPGQHQARHFMGQELDRLAVPRDRERSFEPLLIAKGQTRFDGFNEKS